MACSLAALVGLSTPGAADDTRTAERLFVQHCARCHTVAGSGLPAGHPLLAHFPRPPADFTDALFNSMEPSADWALVVKHGGPSMGLSERMPAHQGRLSDAQIDALAAYLDTFADTSDYPPGELNFVRAQRTIKAFPETETLVLGRYEPGENGDDAWQTTLYHARRLNERLQVEGKLNQLSQAGEYEYEAELGVKWAFWNRDASLLFATGAEAAIPLDDAGGTTLISYLSHAAALGGRFTLQGTLRAHLPTREFGAGDLELSEVVHWRSTPWRRGVFPGLEAIVRAPFDDDAWGVSLVPQLHFAMSKRGHVALNVGVELPLSGATFDYRVLTFVLWDMADGVFWEGW